MLLYPYKNGSEGAKALANSLDILQIKKEGSRFRGGPEKLVINWGNSMSTEEVDKCAVINHPKSVALCANKLHFFQAAQRWNENSGLIDQIMMPMFSTNMDWAGDYVRAGYKIVCRTVLNGHSGEGVVIAETADQLVKAPLYVEYIPKKSEFRVHIFDGQVVDVQRKARNPEIPDDQVNWQVRNHQNGFIYVRDEAADNVPRGVLTNAINAVKMAKLEFGAVDVLWNDRQARAYVLEINTAPGLTGTTLEGYKSRLEQVGKIYAQIVAGKRKNKQAILPEADLAEAFRLFADIGVPGRIPVALAAPAEAIQPVPEQRRRANHLNAQPQINWGQLVDEPNIAHHPDWAAGLNARQRLERASVRLNRNPLDSVARLVYNEAAQAIRLGNLG